MVNSPVTPFRTIGSIEYNVSASSDGRKPSAANPCPNSFCDSDDNASSNG